MRQSLLRAMVLITLLLMVPVLHAQDEEEDLPEIPYHRSSTGFNVPILQLEGWDDQTTREAALFVNTALNARIYVTAVRTLDDEEAIQSAVASLVDGNLPDASHSSRIGLPNGTWTQQHFTLNETSISSFALVRSDRTFVLMLVEDSSDYDAVVLAVRTPLLDETDAETPEVDFPAGMRLAVDTLGLTEDTTPDSEFVPELSGDWLVYNYESDDTPLTVIGTQFNNVTYATVVTATAEDALSLAQAFRTTFLGFFTTPDTNSYLYLGLAVVAIIFVVLVGSMWLRHRNAQKDMALVEQLARDTD